MPSEILNMSCNIHVSSGFIKERWEQEEPGLIIVTPTVDFSETFAYGVSLYAVPLWERRLLKLTNLSSVIRRNRLRVRKHTKDSHLQLFNYHTRQNYSTCFNISGLKSSPYIKLKVVRRYVFFGLSRPIWELFSFFRPYPSTHIQI